ncbi:MAG: sugar phosphate isomerase/epimerase [Ruminococcaceae bacterium]|nr:sugar phosphate isomerase/epimerase [Oscillospiraceae bacterium]
MRLGTSSPLKHDSPQQWAKTQVELGCRAVAFPLSANDPEDKIDEYVKAANANDLLIAEVGIWRNAMSVDPGDRKAQRDYCVRQLQLADRIGARCAVNVAGAIGPRWDGHYRENFTEETRKQIVAMVREIINRSEISNTYFTLEPMPWMAPTGPEDYVRLIEEVDRERFAVHMDIINMTNSFERYYGAEEFVDRCAKLLGNWIRSCHIKDVHLSEEYTFRLEECAPGKGEFPLRYYVEKMNAIDPDMPVILEHLNTDEEYIHYMYYLKEVLDGIQQDI